MHRRSPQHFRRRQRQARCHLRPHRLRKYGSRDKFGAATVSVAKCFRIAAETAAATATELSLRELEAFARAGLSGFFALLHPRIASKQTLAFQSASQIAIGLKKCARHGESRGASLAVNAAAAGINKKIVGADHLRGWQCLTNHFLPRRARKVILDTATLQLD